MRAYIEDWADTWMKIARVVAGRSKDPSTQVGAVLVAADNKLLRQIGYNGSPAAISDSGFDWHDREQKHQFVFHAESNCLWHAADAYGIDKLRDCTLYVTSRPCSHCVLEAVRARLDAIVYDDFAPPAKMCDEENWQRARVIAYKGDVRLLPFSTV